MLDAIDEKFKGTDNLWQKLTDNTITFYFLPIKDMGLTDELYIKMNSRGKPLTLFEHFKAELEREMRAVDEKVCDRIIKKIDLAWTDLLWNYRDSGNGSADDNIVDDEFLRYFKFICDVICYRQGESPQGRSDDEFDLLQRYFSAQTPDALENIKLLEAYFDCWIGIEGYASPTEFLNSFMSYEHENGKIIVDSRYKIDIFEDCLHSYSDRSGRLRQFPLNRIVLLYAIVCYLRNRQQITEEEFVRRIRIVNNLIQNSEDEVSDRIDRNRMPAILAQADAIICHGLIDDSIENHFNVNQTEEERQKILYLEEHPEMQETLFRLEDHQMLSGQIGIIGLDNLQYADRFEALFTCKWDNIDCALMATGNYGQQERNKWRWQFASKGWLLAWQELFHKSANAGFENTHQILIQLLATHETIDDNVLKAIASDFVKECEEKSEYPWRYYYIKYAEYRPGSYGKLSNSKPEECPYLYSVLQTRSQWSSNTYLPYLKAADNDRLDRDSMGQRLTYGDRHIICQNSAYVLRNNEDESVLDTVVISQNEDGIDTEDRVVKLKEYIGKLSAEGINEGADATATVQ